MTDAFESFIFIRVYIIETSHLISMQEKNLESFLTRSDRLCSMVHALA